MIAGVDKFALDGRSQGTWRNAKWKGGVVAALWLFGGVEEVRKTVVQYI